MWRGYRCPADPKLPLVLGSRLQRLGLYLEELKYLMPTLELSSFVAGSLPKLHLALVPNLKHHILRNSAIMDAKMQAETKEEGTHYESGEVSLFRGQEAELIPLVHTTRSFDLTFYILLQMVDLKQWRTPRIKIRWARLKIATRSRRFPGRADLHECRSPDICSPLEIGTAKEGLPSTLCFGADSRRQKQRSSYVQAAFQKLQGKLDGTTWAQNEVD